MMQHIAIQVATCGRRKATDRNYKELSSKQNLWAGSRTWESRKFSEVVDKEVGRRGRKLEPEDFQNELLHSLHLLLRVGVVGDVAKFGHFGRINLLVFPAEKITDSLRAELSQIKSLERYSFQGQTLKEEKCLVECQKCHKWFKLN